MSFKADDSFSADHEPDHESLCFKPLHWCAMTNEGFGLWQIRQCELRGNTGYQVPSTVPVQKQKRDSTKWLRPGSNHCMQTGQSGIC